MARARGAFRAYVARRGASLRGRSRAVVFVALALAACAAPPAEPPPASALAAPAEPAKPVIPAAAPAPAARALDRLVGLRAPQLAALLGRPDLRRRDGHAEIWQYRAGACVLDVFLYDENGGPRVAHAETRSRAGPRSVAPCDEAAVVAKRRAQPLRPATSRL